MSWRFSFSKWLRSLKRPRRHSYRPLTDVLEDRTAPAVMPTHFYDFSGSLNDRLGGPALIADGGAVVNGRYAFSANQGLRLEGALADAESYTVVFRASFQDLTNFVKLMDFENRSADNGLYATGGIVQLFPGGLGETELQANTDFQLALTRDGATGAVNLYINGTHEQTYADVLDTFAASLAFFEDDLITGTEASAGSAEYIAVYDHALSAAEVAAIPFDGPIFGTAVVAADHGVVGVKEGQTAANTGTWGNAVTLSASVGNVVQNADGTWSWSFVTSDGPSDSATVTINATDASGGMASVSFLLNVANVAPTLTALTSNGASVDSASADGQVGVSGFFSDPGTGDTHTVTVDWGDGSRSTATVNQLADAFKGRHLYASGGVFTITVTVTDDDGDTTSRTTTATVRGTGVVGGTLYVVGTRAADHVDIRLAKRAAGKGKPPQVVLKVATGFSASGRFSGRTVTEVDPAKVTRIVVLAGAGNDHVHVHANVKHVAFVLAGAGNDHVHGGGGHNVLVGGDGNDHVHGRGTADILIGGNGADHMHGRRGNDLMIAGAAANQEDVAALAKALADWVARAPVATVTASLGALSWDNAKDKMSGGRGDDVLLFAPAPAKKPMKHR